MRESLHVWFQPYTKQLNKFQTVVFVSGGSLNKGQDEHGGWGKFDKNVSLYYVLQTGSAWLNSIL